MNIALLYLTRRYNFLEFNYNELLNHVNNSKKHNIDLYVYKHDEDISYINNHKEIIFSYKYLKDKFNYNLYDGYIIYGNTGCYSGLMILPFIDLYTNYNKYDYYIYYEDDTLINLDYNFFDTLSDYIYNVDSFFLYKRKLDYSWIWYINSTNLKFKPYTGLLNIYGLRNNILNSFINDIINKGYYGHFEYMVNSYILNKNISRYYLCDNFNVLSKLNSTELIFDKKYDIIHPVKNVFLYNEIKKLNN